LRLHPVEIPQKLSQLAKFSNYIFVLLPAAGGTGARVPAREPPTLLPAQEFSQFVFFDRQPLATFIQRHVLLFVLAPEPIMRFS
jgi:hypothetical protein